MSHIYHIYDIIFKRIFNLSNLAIINLINGLFGTNYEPDARITYLNKEFVNSDLNKRFADLFIQVNGNDTFHLEAQLKKDDTIVVRVFEYCFQQAMNSRDDNLTLSFAEPIVIYLSSNQNIPEESTLTLKFNKADSYEYTVKNFVYLNHDITELNRRKLIILIPFQVLRLQELLNKKPTKENLHLLQTVISKDIIESIEANQKVGNITLDDANMLFDLTNTLYKHICANYLKSGGDKDMKPLLDGAIVLPSDKFRIENAELIEENEALLIKYKTLELKTESLQSTYESLQSSNESLQSSNESLQSSNKQLLERIAELEKQLKSN